MTDNPLPGGEAPTPQELRALLRKKGVRIKELSGFLGYSYNHTSGILSGRVKMPKGFPVHFHEALTTALNAKRAPGAPYTLPPAANFAIGNEVEKIPVILTAAQINAIMAVYGKNSLYPYEKADLPALICSLVSEWILDKMRAGIIPFNLPDSTPPEK